MVLALGLVQFTGQIDLHSRAFFFLAGDAQVATV
jgi:hypothetical protein